MHATETRGRPKDGPFGDGQKIIVTSFGVRVDNVSSAEASRWVGKVIHGNDGR